MSFGTMVVFTDGTDRAGRVKRDDMEKALDNTKYEVFGIALGAEMKESELKKIGRAGTAKAENKDEVLKAFDSIAQRIESSTKSFYLLSYCSPARAGQHKLKIEAEWKGTDGKSSKTGSFETQFDATGFGQGCDPKTPPNFDVHKGDALATKKGEERKAEKKEEKKAEKKAEKKEEKKPAGEAPKPAEPKAAPPAEKKEDFNP
jgi:hypothetical protein